MVDAALEEGDRRSEIAHRPVRTAERLGERGPLSGITAAESEGVLEAFDRTLRLALEDVSLPESLERVCALGIGNGLHKRSLVELASALGLTEPKRKLGIEEDARLEGVELSAPVAR